MGETANTGIRVQEFIVKQQDMGKRLDVYLSEMLEEYSRSFIQQLIKKEKIKVNGKNSKSNYRVRENDIIKVLIPPPEKISIEPQKMDISIIYEDDYIAVINKPQGMVVHPLLAIIQEH